MSPVPHIGHDLEKKPWVQKLKVFGIVTGSIVGLFTAGTALKAAGVPMFVFSNTLIETQNSLSGKISDLYILQAQAEVDARNRIDRSNQMIIFDMMLKIDDMKKAGQAIPSPVVEQLMRYQDDAKTNAMQREQALKRIELNQKR